MQTQTLDYDVESIGIVAGFVWNYLSHNGAVTMSRLARQIDAPRDLVMQSVGWLAREGKVRFRKVTRGNLIELQ